MVFTRISLWILIIEFRLRVVASCHYYNPKR